MPKSEAQLRNEKAVRKIMEERGYDSFWEEKHDKKSDTSRTKKIIIGLVFVMVPIIGLGIGFINMNMRIQKEQTEEALHTCITGLELPPSMSEDPSYEEVRDVAQAKLKYDKEMLSCHEKNKTEKYDDAVGEFSENIERDNLTLCLSNAELNYATSHEEIVNAENDAQSALVIFKRWDSKYSTQIDCYNKYNGTQDFQSELSALRADKSENQSYIDMVNDQIKNQGASGYYSGSTRLHCSTNSVGSYSWTNCY